jgi:hypothetical protein
LRLVVSTFHSNFVSYLVSNQAPHHFLQLKNFETKSSKNWRLGVSISASKFLEQIVPASVSDLFGDILSPINVKMFEKSRKLP